MSPTPRAQARMSNGALGLLVQREIGMDVILHFCCRDRNLLGMQGDLIGRQFDDGLATKAGEERTTFERLRLDEDLRGELRCAFECVR